MLSKSVRGRPEQVETVVDVLTASKYILYCAIGVPLALISLFILSSLFGGKKVRAHHFRVAPWLISNPSLVC